MTHPDRYPPLTPPEHKGPNVVAVFVILCVVAFLLGVVGAGLVWLAVR